jgi:hypothetical protein
MDADTLFLEKCRRVASLLASDSEIELLELSGLIRQLLIDDHPLVGIVNRRPDRVKLVFRVGAFTSKPDKYTAFLSLEDGIDREKRDSPLPIVALSQGDFLKHPVIYSHPFAVTIQQVVLYAANVAGGIHYDPIPKKKHAVMARLTRKVQSRGLPLGIVMLKDIAAVMLRGLEPLIKKVQEREAQKSRPS